MKRHGRKLRGIIILIAHRGGPIRLAAYLPVASLRRPRIPYSQSRSNINGSDIHIAARRVAWCRRHENEPSGMRPECFAVCGR